MCVIPVYFINAPGQNDNEYSHMCELAHTQRILLKSINTDIVVLLSLQMYSMLLLMQRQSRACMSRASHLQYVCMSRETHNL